MAKKNSKKDKELKIRCKTSVFIDDKWVEGDLIISPTQIRVNTKDKIFTYTLDQIDDILRPKRGVKNEIQLDSNTGDKLRLVLPDRYIEPIYRYLSYNMKMDKFIVYFLSPESRGGVVTRGIKWVRGFIGIGRRALWLLSKSNITKIGYDNVSLIELEKRTIGAKERKVLVINHVDEGDVLTSLILCPETTMQILSDYLKRITDKYKVKEELSDIEKEALTLVYSGIDSITIESMLQIDLDKLNEIYDKFEKLGLAKVAKIRKELELTPKGVNFVKEVAKKDSKIIDRVKVM